MMAWVMGGKVKGRHVEGEHIFFDLLELEALWVRLREKKKRKELERERDVTLSH